MPSERSERIKKIRDSRLGSLSAAIGLDARKYDLHKVRNTEARSVFSFCVRGQRNIELALISSGNPEIKELIKDRSSAWYLRILKDAKYSELIQDHINQISKWGLVIVDEGKLAANWQDPILAYERCGIYLKEVYSDRVYSKKEFQIDSLNLLNNVMSTLPSKEELEPDILGMRRERIFAILSAHEAIGTLKVTSNGNIIPSIAIELVGERVESAIDEGLEHPVARLLFQILQKIPGVTLSKLFEIFPLEKKSEIRKQQFISAVSELVKNDLVVAVPDSHRHFLLVPTWVCRHILREYPTYLDAHILRVALGICGSLWENLKSIKDADDYLQKLKADLRWLISQRRIHLEELFQIGPPSSNVIFALRRTGSVRLAGNEELEIVDNRSGIITVLIIVLEGSYRAELDKPSGSIEENVINEIKATANEVKQVISEKLRVSDIEKIKGLK